MLYRKIEKYIVSHLQSGSDKILIVDGARQIGKSFIIREIGKKLFPNYIEVNMETDKLGDRTFADTKTVVAQELKAHGFNLYYYDNKKTGEVDYLIDDMEHLSVLPLEIKSGKDYQVHSALDKFLHIKEYNIRQAFVLSNARQVEVKDGITYLPIYYIMCIEPKEADEDMLL